MPSPEKNGCLNLNVVLIPLIRIWLLNCSKTISMQNHLCFFFYWKRPVSFFALLMAARNICNITLVLAPNTWALLMFSDCYSPARREKRALRRLEVKIKKQAWIEWFEGMTSIYVIKLDHVLQWCWRNYKPRRTLIVELAGPLLHGNSYIKDFRKIGLNKL